MSGPPCHNSSPPDPSFFRVAFADRADVEASAQRAAVGTSSLGCAELPRNHPTGPGERCQSKMSFSEVKDDNKVIGRCAHAHFNVLHRGQDVTLFFCFNKISLKQKNQP